MKAVCRYLFQAVDVECGGRCPVWASFFCWASKSTSLAGSQGIGRDIQRILVLLDDHHRMLVARKVFFFLSMTIWSAPAADPLCGIEVVGIALAVAIPVLSSTSTLSPVICWLTRRS